MYFILYFLEFKEINYVFKINLIDCIISSFDESKISVVYVFIFYSTYLIHITQVCYILTVKHVSLSMSITHQTNYNHDVTHSIEI